MPEIRKPRRRNINRRADRDERNDEQEDGGGGALVAEWGGWVVGGGEGVGVVFGPGGGERRGRGDEVVEFGVEAGGGGVCGVGIGVEGMGGGGGRGRRGREEVGNGDCEFGAEVEG